MKLVANGGSLNLPNGCQRWQQYLSVDWCAPAFIDNVLVKQSTGGIMLSFDDEAPDDACEGGPQHSTPIKGNAIISHKNTVTDTNWTAESSTDKDTRRIPDQKRDALTHRQYTEAGISFTNASQDNNPVQNYLGDSIVDISMISVIDSTPQTHYPSHPTFNCMCHHSSHENNPIHDMSDNCDRDTLTNSLISNETGQPFSAYKAQYDFYAEQPQTFRQQNQPQFSVHRNSQTAPEFVANTLPGKNPDGRQNPGTECPTQPEKHCDGNIPVECVSDSGVSRGTGSPVFLSRYDKSLQENQPVDSPTNRMKSMLAGRRDSVAKMPTATVDTCNNSNYSKTPQITYSVSDFQKAPSVYSEQDVINKQRREIQLLMGELRTRDQELNDLVDSHQYQVKAWERDQDKLTALQQRVTDYEDELEANEQQLKQTLMEMARISEQKEVDGVELKKTKTEMEKLAERINENSSYIRDIEVENKSLCKTVKDLLLSRTGFESRERELLVALDDKELILGDLKTELAKMLEHTKFLESRIEDLEEKNTNLTAESSTWKKKYCFAKDIADRMTKECQDKDENIQKITQQLHESLQQAIALQKALFTSCEREKCKEEVNHSLRKQQKRTMQELQNIRELYDRQNRGLTLYHLSVQEKDVKVCKALEEKAGGKKETEEAAKSREVEAEGRKKKEEETSRKKCEADTGKRSLESSPRGRGRQQSPTMRKKREGSPHRRAIEDSPRSQGRDKVYVSPSRRRSEDRLTSDRQSSPHNKRSVNESQCQQQDICSSPRFLVKEKKERAPHSRANSGPENREMVGDGQTLDRPESRLSQKSGNREGEYQRGNRDHPMKRVAHTTLCRNAATITSSTSLFSEDLGATGRSRTRGRGSGYSERPEVYLPPYSSYYNDNVSKNADNRSIRSQSDSRASDCQKKLTRSRSTSPVKPREMSPFSERDYSGQKTGKGPKVLVEYRSENRHGSPKVRRRKQSLSPNPREKRESRSPKPEIPKVREAAGDHDSMSDTSHLPSPPKFDEELTPADSDGMCHELKRDISKIGSACSEGLSPVPEAVVLTREIKSQDSSLATPRRSSFLRKEKLERKITFSADDECTPSPRQCIKKKCVDFSCSKDLRKGQHSGSMEKESTRSMATQKKINDTNKSPERQKNKEKCSPCGKDSVAQRKKSAHCENEAQPKKKQKSVSDKKQSPSCTHHKADKVEYSDESDEDENVEESEKTHSCCKKTKSSRSDDDSDDCNKCKGKIKHCCECSNHGKHCTSSKTSDKDGKSHTRQCSILTQEAFSASQYEQQEHPYIGVGKGTVADSVIRNFVSPSSDKVLMPHCDMGRSYFANPCQGYSRIGEGFPGTYKSPVSFSTSASQRKTFYDPVPGPSIFRPQQFGNPCSSSNLPLKSYDSKTPISPLPRDVHMYLRHRPSKSEFYCNNNRTITSSPDSHSNDGCESGEENQDQRPHTQSHSRNEREEKEDTTNSNQSNKQKNKSNQSKQNASLKETSSEVPKRNFSGTKSPLEKQNLLQSNDSQDISESQNYFYSEGGEVNPECSLKLPDSKEDVISSAPPIVPITTETSKPFTSTKAPSLFKHLSQIHFSEQSGRYEWTAPAQHPKHTDNKENEQESCNTGKSSRQELSIEPPCNQMSRSKDVDPDTSNRFDTGHFSSSARSSHQNTSKPNHSRNGFDKSSSRKSVNSGSKKCSESEKLDHRAERLYVEGDNKKKYLNFNSSNQNNNNKNSSNSEIHCRVLENFSGRYDDECTINECGDQSLTSDGHQHNLDPVVKKLNFNDSDFDQSAMNSDGRVTHLASRQCHMATKSTRMVNGHTDVHISTSENCNNGDKNDHASDRKGNLMNCESSVMDGGSFLDVSFVEDSKARSKDQAQDLFEYFKDISTLLVDPEDGETNSEEGVENEGKESVNQIRAVTADGQGLNSGDGELSTELWTDRRRKNHVCNDYFPNIAVPFEKDKKESDLVVITNPSSVVNHDSQLNTEEKLQNLQPCDFLVKTVVGDYQYNITPRGQASDIVLENTRDSNTSTVGEPQGETTPEISNNIDNSTSNSSSKTCTSKAEKKKGTASTCSQNDNSTIALKDNGNCALKDECENFTKSSSSCSLKDSRAHPSKDTGVSVLEGSSASSLQENSVGLQKVPFGSSGLSDQEKEKLQTWYQDSVDEVAYHFDEKLSSFLEDPVQDTTLEESLKQIPSMSPATKLHKLLLESQEMIRTLEKSSAIPEAIRIKMMQFSSQDCQ